MIGRDDISFLYVNKGTVAVILTGTGPATTGLSWDYVILRPPVLLMPLSLL